MTSITLTLTGAKARAAVNGPLTSGMVGIPVTIEYDDAWEGLTKSLVCRSGQWGPGQGGTRTVRCVGNAAAVAPEVMKADTHLYLGVEGYRADGTLVLPSTWADCGPIQPGANAGADPAADPGLPLWAQLQTEMDQLRDQALLRGQVAGALDDLFRLCAFTSADAALAYAAFQAAFGISGAVQPEPGDPDTPDVPEEPDGSVELTGISVTYGGGDVPAGTALSDLTDLLVTAHYSDGTSAAVTGYTLSGTIGEGENTITVLYGGMTAGFTVVGIAQAPDENNGWTEGEACAITWTDGYGIDHAGTLGGGSIGAIYEVSSRSVSDLLPCRGASALFVSGIYTNYGVFFYDENQQFVIKQVPADWTAPVPVPLTAYFVRVQCLTTNKASAAVTPVMLPVLTENTPWETGTTYCLEWEYGKQIKSGTGVEAAHTSATRNVSKFTLCAGAATVTFSHKLRSLCAFYDGDRNYVGEIIFNTTNATAEVPESAVYFRYDTYGYADNMNVTVKLS